MRSPRRLAGVQVPIAILAAAAEAAESETSYSTSSSSDVEDAEQNDKKCKSPAAGVSSSAPPHNRNAAISRSQIAAVDRSSIYKPGKSKLTNLRLARRTRPGTYIDDNQQLDGHQHSDIDPIILAPRIQSVEAPSLFNSSPEPLATRSSIVIGGGGSSLVLHVAPPPRGEDYHDSCHLSHHFHHQHRYHNSGDPAAVIEDSSVRPWKVREMNHQFSTAAGEAGVVYRGNMPTGAVATSAPLRSESEPLSPPDAQAMVDNYSSTASTTTSASDVDSHQNGRLESMDHTLLYILMNSRSAPRRAPSDDKFYEDGGKSASFECFSSKPGAVPSGAPAVSESALSPARSSYRSLRFHRGPRLTIFSDEFLRQMQKQRGNSGIRTALRSPTGMLLQALVFTAMVLFLGITPIIKEAALWNAELEKKTQNFVPQSPYILHFGMSVIVANIGAYLSYGRVGVKDCWNMKSILKVSKVSIFYAVGESMEMFTLLFIDGTSWKILNQLKLPVTAVINFVILQRQQTPTQWVLILSTSISILGYCLASTATGATEVCGFGIAVGIVNVMIVTFAGTVADVTYKKVQFPFCILVAQGRLSACLITFLIMVADQLWHREFRWFLEGWNWRVLLLTIWLLLKDWSVTFVLRNLDSMWKAIGTAMGLCVTYVLASAFVTKSVNSVIAVFVSSVVVNILAFTITKREELTRADELATLKKNLQSHQDLITTLEQQRTADPSKPSSLQLSSTCSA